MAGFPHTGNLIQVLTTTPSVQDSSRCLEVLKFQVEGMGHKAFESQGNRVRD